MNLNRRDFVGACAAAFGNGTFKDWLARGTAIVSGKETLSAEFFSERAREASIDFVHFNGMSGEHYYAEIVGSGAALFDYDNDGDLESPWPTPANSMHPVCIHRIDFRGSLSGYVSSHVKCNH